MSGLTHEQLMLLLQKIDARGDLNQGLQITVSVGDIVFLMTMLINERKSSKVPDSLRENMENIDELFTEILTDIAGPLM